MTISLRGADGVARIAAELALDDFEDAVLKRLAIPEALDALRMAACDIRDRRVSLHIVDYGDLVSFRVGNLVAQISREDMRELVRLYQDIDTRRGGK